MELQLEPGADRFGCDRYSRAGKFGQRMRIAMTSPSFEVMAKVPSPPRNDQTRATDRKQPIRPKAMRVALKRD
jgi:hypothetical protein